MTGVIGGLVGSFDNLPVPGVFARYTADSFVGTTWQDISGNGRNASVSRGTVTKTSTTGNGAAKTFSTLQGSVNDGILFPADVLPATYTLFHVTRYTGGTKGRIFTGLSNNWLSGFWKDNTAAAFHEGWLTNYNQRRVFQNNWVISTDQNSLYRGNAITYGTSGGSASTRLTVNAGVNTEYSDWQCSEVIVYDRTLTATEYQRVESYLNFKYGTDIYGTIIPSSPYLTLDAADTSSYPGSGVVWYDTSGNNRHFYIATASAYNSSGPKYMDFNGSFGRAHQQSPYEPGGLTTYCLWTRIKQSTATWRTLTRAINSGGNHHVIIESGSYRIGMYDNDTATAYRDSGFLQTSLPGWNSGQWNFLAWRWQDDRLRYTLSINGSPNVIVGSNSEAAAAYKGDIGAIGGYHNGTGDPASGSQYWGDISQLAVYSRNLTDSEVLAIYNLGKSRHGL